MSPRPCEESFAAGTLLDGKYRVERVLGRGAMGAVLLATDVILERAVAIKVPTYASFEDLRVEAKAMARVRHENVVQLYAFGVHEGQPYLVMEFIEGTDLETLLHDQGRFDAVAALGVFEKVAAGLAAIHQEGIVHYDVKPANVLIGPRYRVCVSDFGLAGLTRPNAEGVSGTPEYMSPEVLLEETLDRAHAHLSDQYSLAITLYEMLAGELPFEADDLNSLIVEHLKGEPIPIRRRRPELPEALEAVLLRGMARDPMSRYSDCITFARAARRAWTENATAQEGRSVLIVDDDRDVREFYTAVIEESFPDVWVKTAADGLQALEIAMAQRPDLVLLDLEMPRLDGVGFARAFRASPALGDVPVVVISGHVGSAREDTGFEQDARVLRELGAKDQLAKPIMSLQLIDVLRTHLPGH